MASVNQATILGFVGDEPKITPLNGGNKMTQFNVATTVNGFTRQDGSSVPERTEWHHIVISGKLADVVERYVHKGSQVYVQGRICYRTYVDNQGQKRYTTEISCNTLQLCDRRPEASAPAPYGQSQNDIPF